MDGFVLLWKGQQPLVIGLGLCVYSSVLPWQVCTTHKQEKRLSQHPQVSRARLFPNARFNSHRLRLRTNPWARCGCCHRCWDRRQTYQIFICLLCSGLGKMLGSKWKLVPKRNEWTFRTRSSIHFAFSSENMRRVCPARDVLIYICPYGTCNAPYCAASHIKVPIQPAAINVGFWGWGSRNWNRLLDISQRGWKYDNLLYPVTLQNSTW